MARGPGSQGLMVEDQGKVGHNVTASLIKLPRDSVGQRGTLQPPDLCAAGQRPHPGGWACQGLSARPPAALRRPGFSGSALSSGFLSGW